MAITASNPGKEDLTATQASFAFPASGNWTPISGEAVYILVGNRKGTGTADTPTLTGTNGWNVTWTQVATITTGGSTLNRATLFRGVPSSSVAGKLTADFGGTNQAQCGIVVVSCAGVDQATNQGVVQSATDSAAVNGALAATLSGFGHADNATLLVGVARGTPSGFTVEDGSYTGYSVTGGVTGFGAAIKIGNDTSPTATLTSGTNWAAIAIEIKAAAGGPAVEQLIPPTQALLNSGGFIGVVYA